MALTREFMGAFSIFERSSSSSSSKVLLNQSTFWQNKLLQQKQFLVPVQQRRVHSRKAGAAGVRRGINNPVAALSEDLVKGAASSAVPGAAEKPVKFKVRAVLTVKKNIKEDFKETLVNQFDALTEKIGRNVVLELVGTEVDPSKCFCSLCPQINFCSLAFSQKQPFPFGSSLHMILMG